MHSNYLDKNMMYLADAEIDENAFNSFFGSSVLEYAKFFTRVYVEGFLRPEKLGPHLWGEAVPTCPVKDRKWTQYIAVGADLIANDETIKVTVPLEATCAGAALPKEGAVNATFTDTTFKLEVTLNGVVHRLDGGELLYRIDPKESVAKIRQKTKKVILEMKKLEKGKTWKKLTAL